LTSLSPPPLGILSNFDASRLALRYEMAVGFNLSQDTTHLHHLLEAV
jgi:hypothetical protein